MKQIPDRAKTGFHIDRHNINLIRYRILSLIGDNGKFSLDALALFQVCSIKLITDLFLITGKILCQAFHPESRG